MQELKQLCELAHTQVDKADDLKSLMQLKVDYLGKKGKLTGLLKGLKDLPIEERKAFGRKVNEAKNDLLETLEQKKESLERMALNAKCQEETIDVTLRGRDNTTGSLHPISKSIERMERIFEQMGFEVCLGPEIETEYYNFEALNIPAHHPARAMQDTFFLPGKQLLRTHTSPVQIRTMEHSEPPIKIIAPGRVYRCDSDLTHTPMFHQIEGLIVDTDITMAHLKGILYEFLKAYFESDFDIRFRPSYFPFTEPSAEVDIGCVKCNGKGCRICKNTGWLEVLGCGMVHPKVLEYGGIDPETYTGFAFGLGIERFAMLRYSVDDLRVFFENDLKVLQQFSGA